MTISVFAQHHIKSPDGRLRLDFTLENAAPKYALSFDEQPVILPSKLGFALNNLEMLRDQFVFKKHFIRTVDQTWNPVWGEESEIRDHYVSLRIELEQQHSMRILVLEFRLYNEGLAFRYVFPPQYDWKNFRVLRELTEFNLAFDADAFWLPGDFDSQEYRYEKSKLSQIDTRNIDMDNGIGFKGSFPPNRVQSPLLMRTDSGLYVNIFEAALVDYPVMHLEVDTQKHALSVSLPADDRGFSADVQTPWKSPWRTVFVVDDARKLVESRMTLNLNEPSKIEDTSWIKPMKYVGIWWEMHIGKATWDFAATQRADAHENPKTQARHGATTQNAKRYIDFAHKHGFDAVLIEGWNTGWENWYGTGREDVFDFVTPYPDFDIAAVSQYAKQKNIRLIMHHETSGAVAQYERRLNAAFDVMEKFGYDAVKTGYVGYIVPDSVPHDSQRMVKHYHDVVQQAAERKIAVNSHESSRPTGVHRTWPNYMAAEAARGNEFNAWSNGNPPEHETILPFTRLLGGPMDYTPGIFEPYMNHYDASKTAQVQTTLAKQLALYVTMYSPVQMAADLPENYERYPDAFQFIKDVPVDWSKTVALEAEPGDYLTIARRDKNSSSWFIGAITDEQPRETTLSLDFLPEGRFEAIIYADGADAHWKTNAKSYRIEKRRVTNKDSLSLRLASSGGAAVHLKPLK